VSSNNKGTDKENTQIKQQDGQSNSHCLVPCTLPSCDDCPPPGQLPPAGTQHGGTWYRIPCSVWPGGVSPPGYVPSWLLVKIYPILAKPRASGPFFILSVPAFAVCDLAGYNCPFLYHVSYMGINQEKTIWMEV